MGAGVRRSVAIACAVLVLPAGCGDDAPSEADAQACHRLQQVVDELAVGRSAAAMVRLSELDVEIQLVDDDELRDAGNAFFEAITGEVENFGDLTAAETVELSQRLVSNTVPLLGTVLQRCDDLGVAVDLSDVPE